MFGVRISKLGSASKLGLIAKAIGILRSYGADAHVYLPGVGTISGITAGNYLDSAGVTAASVDNPVGLSLDGLGAWEDVPQNWVKASGDGVVTAVGNIITITGATTTTRVDLSPSHPFVDGYLKAEFTVTWSSATSVYVYIAGGASVPVNGTRTTYGIPSKNSTLDCVQIDSGTATFVIHSLRLNRGIFASQTTTANKPILRRGAVNLLTYSNDLSNAAWTKNYTPVTGLQDDPNGGTSAFKLTPTTDAVQHTVVSANISAGTYTFAAIAKNTGYNLTISSYDGTSYKAASIFNLSSGVVAVSVVGSTSEILSLGGGWYLCRVTATLTGSSNFGGLQLRPNIGGTSDISESAAGNGVSSVTVYRAGIFQGTYTAQQIIDAGGIPLTTSAAASSTTGKYWGQFDSTDLLTATYPAGYESATIINALTSGVTTTQGVNVVGSYSIGPSVNTAGRIVLKTAPTAEKLAVLQSFMGLLI